jgi:hypothetical protein
MKNCCHIVIARNKMTKQFTLIIEAYRFLSASALCLPAGSDQPWLTLRSE